MSHLRRLVAFWNSIWERLTRIRARPAAWLAWFRQALIIAVVFALLYGLGTLLPPGFDWRIHFSRKIVPSFWVPWTILVLRVLDWPTVVALTILGVGLRVFRYRPSPVAAALALFSFPTLWVIFDGTLDGLVLIGLLLLPWGVPLVLLKPQVASFALLAKRRSFIAAAMWGLLSLVIWGLWPLTFSTLFQPNWRSEWPQDISLFPWGLILALPLLWLSRGDEDMLMAAGSLGTPHVFPYHFIVLMPALARLSWPWMIATWLVSWTPLLANWWGPWAWHLGNLTSLFFWMGLYLSKRQRPVHPAASDISIGP